MPGTILVKFGAKLRGREVKLIPLAPGKPSGGGDIEKKSANKLEKRRSILSRSRNLTPSSSLPAQTPGIPPHLRDGERDKASEISCSYPGPPPSPSRGRDSRAWVKSHRLGSFEGPDFLRKIWRSFEDQSTFNSPALRLCVYWLSRSAADPRLSLAVL